MVNKVKKAQLWLNLLIFSIILCLAVYYIFFYNIPCVNCSNVVELATYTSTVSPTITPQNTPTKMLTKQQTATPTVNIPISTNTPTLTPTKKPTVKPTSTKVPTNLEWCVSAVNICGTRIRTQPYLTSTIIGIMYNNQPQVTDVNNTGIACYKLVDYVEVDSTKWYVIQYNHPKQLFYVHPKYSKLYPILP